MPNFRNWRFNLPCRKVVAHLQEWTRQWPHKGACHQVVHLQAWIRQWRRRVACLPGRLPLEQIRPWRPKECLQVRHLPGWIRPWLEPLQQVVSIRG